MQKGSDPKEIRPPQEQEMPGIEQKMSPQPVSERPHLPRKLQGKKALITGGDSGIGAATAILFAQEGAHVAIVYLSEEVDAADVKKNVEKHGGKCILLKGNIRDEEFCKKAVADTVGQLGGLDILVNNAATQTEQQSIEDISTEQLKETFETNIFPMFWFTKYALPHLKDGSCIINTTSVTAYRGSASLLNYSSTKGAIVAFTAA